MDMVSGKEFEAMSLDSKRVYCIEHPYDPAVREWIAGVSESTPFEEMGLTDRMIYANAHPDDPAVKRWLNR